MFKRVFDIGLCLFSALILVIPMLLIAGLIKATSEGPIIYWSERVGVGNKIFEMAKFRSMKVDTPVIATHLLRNPSTYLTPIGAFLRKTSLDELPQIWNVLKGEMSIIGPRPALFNQLDLIYLRSQHGIEMLRPGLTGLAQIKGRDKLSLKHKVKYDLFYFSKRTIFFDIYIILKTMLRVLNQADIEH